ncbi:GTPase IMAP family member 8-like [Betta splendens]|uniref:GTPase IMAP family member 8-like n=1 Tax=Betta splendens TaxID=158456 RepID=A0A6P7P8J4_BETSP|nr:GTPase IMAP family member 8-like [Betta splendens]
MSFDKGSTSPPSDWTIAVFAKKTDFKKKVVDIICKHVSAENSTFTVITTPEVFDEQCLYPDQQIIDFMARSLPGPNIFILAIDSENSSEEDAVTQITKLQTTIGQNVTEQLAVVIEVIEDINIYDSLTCLRDAFSSIQLTTLTEDLADKCNKWRSGPFQYDYKNYSADVVRRRKNELESNRSVCLPSYHQCVARNNSPSTSQCTVALPAAAPTAAPCEPNKVSFNTNDDCFNIVLLGLTGTGKSASVNTILTYGNSSTKSKNFVQSEPSSMPITTECNAVVVEKFKRQIRVVDTPDFFNDHIKNSQAQIHECRKYCQPGQCVVLLVFQLGRFTDGEAKLLGKLEETFGWKIRDSAVVLLTHGESFEGNPDQFIGERSTLKSIVEACGNRYHVFRNTHKDPKQVVALMRKFPNCEKIFPKLSEKNPHNGKKNECSLC